MKTLWLIGSTAANLAAVALLLITIALPATAQSLCGPQLPGGTRAADPAALAAAWLPQLERLYAAIPNLSPRENQGLEAEMRGDGQRSVRAIASREYALQMAKGDVGSLLASLRSLSGAKQSAAQQAHDWLLFAYFLIEEDADLYLAGLVSERIIPLEALPTDWTVFANPTGLRDSIRWRRMSLARHVLMCVVAPRLPER